MKKLFGWALIVAATWAVYHHSAANLNPHTDAFLLALIAVVSFGCVAVQLVWTWRWRALSLGLLSFFLGTALLYTRVSAGAWGYTLWQEQRVLSLIRALYLTGAVLTATGLAQWAWRNYDRAFPWWRQADGRDPFLSEGSDD